MVGSKVMDRLAIVLLVVVVVVEVEVSRRDESRRGRRSSVGVSVELVRKDRGEKTRVDGYPGARLRLGLF